MKKEKALWGRILPLLLSLCLVLSMLPGMGTRALAAGEGEAVSDGATALSINVNTSEAQVVYYGGRPYYVIGYGADGVQTADSSDTTATLLAKTTFAESFFNSYDNRVNQYSGSILQSEMDGIAAALSQQEKAAIRTRTLAVGTFSGYGENACDGVAGTAVDNAYLWPLSTKEALALDENIRITDPEHMDWASSYWWLRSPARDETDVDHVLGNGTISECDVTFLYGVRPAFHLNLHSVLFTTAAVDGKWDGLQEIKDYSGNEWKLTLKDSSRDRFTIVNVRRTGNSVTVYYSGAKEGSNEYISLLIADSTGAFTHYGRLAKASAAGAASVTFTLPELGEGSKVYIFNEQCNDDYQTDYAGDLVELAIPQEGSQDSREVELRNDGTQIQWKYKDEPETDWRDLVALDAITGGNGADGADGREVELRMEGGYVQWRYTSGSDTTWKNLITLSDLKGQDGADGREVELKNDGTAILWRYVGEGDEAWRPLVDLSDITGSDGADGKQVELRVEGGYIQWRYTGGEWQNLIALSALQGIKGDKGDKGDPGDTPYIGNNGNWWIGETDTGIPATGDKGDKGEDGLTPYIGNNGNWWIGETDTGVPATGDKGEDGLTPYIGTNGNWWIGGTDTGIPATGDKGENGLTPQIGENGNWWIGETDTGIPATGYQGEDGLTPYIGDNGNWWIGGTDTGIPAIGDKGETGQTGANGLTPYIGTNGNWWIGSTDTGVRAAGQNGKDGQDGKDGANGKDGQDGKDGADGKDGIGIADLVINENGELVVTLTDGTVKNLGKVTGSDGVSVAKMEINSKGELLITLTDGTQLNAGPIPVAESSQTLVYVSLGVGGVSLAGLLGVLAVLLKRKR